MDATRAAAFAAFARRLDPHSSAPVAVALSGGGDSMALLHLAVAWKRPVTALTVDHGLNPDSGAWTRFAGEAAAEAGAQWRALIWEGTKPSTGLPAAARAARHRLLAQAAHAAGAKVLLTGHTLDDVLEGELMRAEDAPGLGRLREWSPSPAWPEGRGLFLLRPLLQAGREELRDWLRARSIPWLDDPANEDSRYARTRARILLPSREKVAPQGPDEGAVQPRSPHQQGRLGGHAPSSVAFGATFSRGGEKVSQDGRIVLDRDKVSLTILSAALLCASGTDAPPRGEPLNRLLERLRGSAPVQATLAGARVVAQGAEIQIGRDPGRRGLPELVVAGPTLWDGRFEIAADEPGWSAAPLAGRIARLPPEDRRLLSSIPAWARGVLPALVHADGTVRLPRPIGLGPGFAASLAGERLAAACGLVAQELQIWSRRHGASDVVTLCSGP